MSLRARPQPVIVRCALRKRAQSDADPSWGALARLLDNRSELADWDADGKVGLREVKRYVDKAIAELEGRKKVGRARRTERFAKG